MSVTDNFAKSSSDKRNENFDLALWRQRQLFWARDKSAIKCPTEGLINPFCNHYFKI